MQIFLRELIMKKVKIAVLKTTLDKELASEYETEELTVSPMLKADQIFYADYSKPDKFYNKA
ncbi:hypothetical protein [Fusobacterium sp.]|uniref:hypothetical protein n=1 Tax=Fusobacterium sp. TaxID=68766 RepID=UPI002915CF0C|nr:hypothetical protein [Fusobacterium sp.]